VDRLNCLKKTNKLGIPVPRFYYKIKISLAGDYLKSVNGESGNCVILTLQNWYHKRKKLGILYRYRKFLVSCRIRTMALVFASPWLPPLDRYQVAVISVFQYVDVNI
jgi:hypothetical protein